MRLMDRTTSMPESVLHYELDKVRYLDLETGLSQFCPPKYWITNMAILTGLRYIIYWIYFRSYSPVNVCRCGNIYYIFGHVQKLTFVVFNFSVIFIRSFDLVKWITLDKKIVNDAGPRQGHDKVLLCFYILIILFLNIEKS